MFTISLYFIYDGDGDGIGLVMYNPLFDGIYIINPLHEPMVKVRLEDYEQIKEGGMDLR